MAVVRAAFVRSRWILMARVRVLGVVAAFALAPLLANVWPAFGKGQMLYVGEVAAADVDHSAHEGHHAAGRDSHHSPAGHQVHCALCVLALLGWAPPVDLSFDWTETRVIDRAVHLAATAPRLLLLWPDAQARAPPLS
jgi:hypothetical protein